MRMFMILALTLLPALAVADGGLRKGLYVVQVEPKIPNVDLKGMDKEVRICWQGPSKAKTPLGPLGPGPLKACPSKARSTEGGIEVTTTCPGPNMGHALSRYRVTSDGFRGWVSMNMGGKNMTVTEKQTGTWVGRC